MLTLLVHRLSWRGDEPVVGILQAYSACIVLTGPAGHWLSFVRQAFFALLSCDLVHQDPYLRGSGYDRFFAAHRRSRPVKTDPAQQNHG